MKKTQTLFIVLAVVGILSACSEDFLNIKPKGSLAGNVMATKGGVDALLIGAYSMLDGVSSQFGWEAASSNWVYCSIRGMEANKGTDSGDQPDINPIQTFSETATNPYLNIRWQSIYEGIARANSVILMAADALAAGTITQDEHDSFVKQSRALRGCYHFEAWRMWGKVPYVDEKTLQDTLTNRGDISSFIYADLLEGTTLPNDMDQIGRFNGTVSKVLLAKAKMQIDHAYGEALTLLNDAKNGTKPNGDAIGLASTYGEIFDIEYRNGTEAVYTVQYSVNDGSSAWNAGWGEVLNFPYKGGGGSPGGCCGFFNPTQEFVNSFRTNAGLPYLEIDATNNWGEYNNHPVASDQGINFADPFTEDAGPLDPRLDWAVGRRGIPYWDWGIHTGSDWIRDQTYSGPFSPKKQVYKKSQEGTYTEVGNWTSGYTANGYRMIRYADVLLLLAECEIEAGSLANARTIINQIRARAANTAGFVKEADGVTNAANYVINQYPATGYPFDSQANARKALYMERKLELGMEGHRYFDLNRWGIMVAELTRVLKYEKTMPWSGLCYGSAVIGVEDVTSPIPQRQIDLSVGKIEQNR